MLFTIHRIVLREADMWTQPTNFSTPQSRTADVPSEGESNLQLLRPREYTLSIDPVGRDLTVRLARVVQC